MGLQTTSTRPRLTNAVSNNLATANKEGSRLEEASSMLSSDRRQRASMRYLTEVSDNSVEDSNNLVTMLDKTGKSAIKAVVVMDELFSEPAAVELDPEPDVEEDNAPPVIGFKPKIQTKCCRVVRMICQDDPKRFP